MKTQNSVLDGLNIALFQMEVVPGRPDVNALNIIAEAKNAEAKGAKIFIAPEAAVQGYFIGDRLRDNAFVVDCEYWNQKIIDATKDLNIVIIFGSVYVPRDTSGNPLIGEHGAWQKWNAAFVARNGELVPCGALPVAVKSLMADYGVFGDNRHYHSAIKIAADNNVDLRNILGSAVVLIDGKSYSLGVMLCEDMWHKHYSHNLGELLVELGAQILINLSCSPWSWQKNRKRHEVVRELLKYLQVYFIYVNNAGGMNNGRSIINFDGSSAIYHPSGELLLELLPYEAYVGYYEVCVNKYLIIQPRNLDDTTQLYWALKNSAEHMRDTLPLNNRKVVVGLSGGIDSATVLALMVQVFGAENCTAINMPSEYNSALTKDIARDIASNLSVEYKVIPIGEIVELKARLLGIVKGTLDYENLQATERMTILKAEAAKRGAVFTANGNKVEAAFGYCTLYGDTAGFYMPIGDLVKREVRQVAYYMNQFVYNSAVIPMECIEMIPTAELAGEQTDPFDYGTLIHRGYHDELVRAWTVFEKNVEWVLWHYMNGTLEVEFKLDPGTLERVFSTDVAFVADLEKRWSQFDGGMFFKRNQFPPIPKFSKVAFGGDKQESLLSPHFTQRFCDMRQEISPIVKDVLSERIVIMGLSGNPTGIHHRKIAEQLSLYFDKVIVVLCGQRPDKNSLNIDKKHRKTMAQLGFRCLPKVEFDFFDLEKDEERFTPNVDLLKRYLEKYSNDSIWFQVGPDIIQGGATGESQIQKVWKEGSWVWENLRFAIVHNTEEKIERKDMPPTSETFPVQNLVGRSTMIRELIISGNEKWKHMVMLEVARYIQQYDVYPKK